MKQNLANADRIIRALFAVVVAVLYLSGAIFGTLALVLGIVAVVLLATSVVGLCPVYSLLKISTKKPTTTA